MFPESLEYLLSAFMMESYVIFGVDSHVVHVKFQPLFCEHICEDMIHESLEGGGSIAESEEHDNGFKKSHGGDESGLPLVFLPDANVVGGFLHIVDELWDEGEWIGIPDSVGVQVAVILAWTKGSILLWHKEEGGGLGRF